MTYTILNNTQLCVFFSFIIIIIIIILFNRIYFKRLWMDFI